MINRELLSVSPPCAPFGVISQTALSCRKIKRKHNSAFSDMGPFTLEPLPLKKNVNSSKTLNILD
jgi:hypothetical protein